MIIANLGGLKPGEPSPGGRVEANMSQNKKQPRYFSCLLRFWQTDDGEQRVWQVSLEYPVTGERRGFATLADLFAYLEAETAPEKD